MPTNIDTTPSESRGVKFTSIIYARIETDDPSVDEQPDPKPTYCLYNGSYLWAIWNLEQPAPDDSPEVIALKKRFNMQNGEVVPVESAEWLRIDTGAGACSVESLHETYCQKDEVPNDPEPETYQDAKIITPFNPSDYEGRAIVVSRGAHQFSKNWKPEEMPLIAFVDMSTKHKNGRKDGLAFVPGNMFPGRRVKTAIKTCTAIGLDIDTGTPSAVVDAAIAKLGCLAWRYTTHSNGKRSSEINKGKIHKFAPTEDENDSEIIKRFLLEKEYWDKEIVRTVKFVEEDHTEQGIVCRISHAPMPKHRVIIPLELPYEIAKQGRTQMEAMAKWAKVIAAMAALLGLPFDKSCIDPSRLFYFPRHDKGRPFEISLFGGPLFDLKSLNLDSTFDKMADEFTKNKSGNKSVTEEGRALGQWWMKFAHGFQLMDVIEEYAPDMKRSKATSGYNVCCPFDEDHSNAGDAADQACFVVNAAEGGNEFCLVSCRHETCRDKTTNDHIGKMLRDGWFDKDVLTDPNFNIAEIEGEESEPSQERHPNGDAPPLKDYKEAISGLRPSSTAEDIEAAVTLCVKAKLSVAHKEQVIKEIVANSVWNKSTIKSMFKEISDKHRGSLDIGVKAESGALIYRHAPQFDFHEASDIVTAAIFAKNESDGVPTVSAMGGETVLLSKGEDGKVGFDKMTRDALWSHATKLVKFVKVADGAAGEPQKVPEDVAKHVFEQARNKFRQSPQVVYTPMFLRDGALLETPKYHYDENDPTYLNHLLILRNDFKVPKIPHIVTRERALDSLKWIRVELLNDFPFSDIDNKGQESRAPGEAHALALLLTPFMRRMIPTQTPIFFVSKPKGGTGGTLLGWTAIMLFDGEVRDPITYYADDTNMQKEIITVARWGSNFMFFDDVEEFCSRVIYRTVSSPMIGGRLLGGNNKFSCPNRQTWVATGNNLPFTDQMDRRTVHIRLNAKTADLQARKFRHGGEDLKFSTSGYTYKDFVARHRGEAVAHLLTLIEYWIQIGRPASEVKPKLEFEEWSAAVGGVLEAVGVEGFLQGKSGAEASEQEAAEQYFVSQWHKKYGDQSVTPNDLFNDASAVSMEILKGRSDDLKRERFNKDLRLLNGNCFKVGPVGSKVEVMVVSTNSDDGLKFSLVRSGSDE